MPGIRRRTIASAQRIPNSVFSGTTIAVISTVSFSAWTASGFETAAQNGWKPCSNARQNTSPTGATRIAPRYASDPNLMIMPSGPPAQCADCEEKRERDRQHENGERRGAGGVVAVYVLEHVQRGDLGLERDVPGDEHDRAELTDRARECQGHAGEERRQQVRKDDAAKDRDAAGAERCRGILHV